MPAKDVRRGAGIGLRRLVLADGELDLDVVDAEKTSRWRFGAPVVHEGNDSSSSSGIVRTVTCGRGLDRTFERSPTCRRDSVCSGVIVSFSSIMLATRSLASLHILGEDCEGVESRDFFES